MSNMSLCQPLYDAGIEDPESPEAKVICKYHCPYPEPKPCRRTELAKRPASDGTEV